MSNTVLTKTYTEPPVDLGEILRYAGCKEAKGELASLLQSAIGEIKGKLSYKACYTVFNVEITGDVCDFGNFTLKSQRLAENLNGSKRVILFAATVGLELDRLIAKYGHISPARAIMLNAVGAERIEALCNLFCADIAAEMGVSLKPRFSAGYGDLPLETQKDIFKSLNCAKKIGLSLNNSLLMSPSKSVTAFVGIGHSLKVPNSLF